MNNNPRKMAKIGINHVNYDICTNSTIPSDSICSLDYIFLGTGTIYSIDGKLINSDVEYHFYKYIGK